VGGGSGRLKRGPVAAPQGAVMGGGARVLEKIGPYHIDILENTMKILLCRNSNGGGGWENADAVPSPVQNSLHGGICPN